jgi:hypothetical protein
MTQSNDILQSILSNFPVSELGSDTQQRLFESIKNRLIGAPDSFEELKTLYKVNGFADFATGLMWMVERAEKTSGQTAIGPEDETLLLSSFRKAAGEQAPSQEGSPPSADDEGEKGFASLVEQFAEAVQSGAGESKMLLQDLISECESIGRRGGAADFVELSSYLAEFLKYISESDLLDDVRVINILSNASSVVSQWSITAASAREGILEEALASLRDFKSHFE